MSSEASIELQVVGCAQTLRVQRWLGREAVAELDRHELSLVALGTDARRDRLDLDALLGARATLLVRDGGTERAIHGIVDELEAGGHDYRIVVVPRAAVLRDEIDHRVFLAMSAVEIIGQVFAEHGLDLELRLADPPGKRAQCVQAFEATLDFVTRLCAEEGMLWHVEHSAGRDVVVLSDNAAAYPPIDGGERLTGFDGASSGLTEGDAIYELGTEQQRVVDRIALCDFDFEKADVDLSTSVGEGPVERFEHDAGYSDHATGRRLAAVRLEQARARELVLSGTTSCRRLAPGRTFEIAGAPHDAHNGRWVVLELNHSCADHGAGADGGRRYVARLRGGPASIVQRPPPARPASASSLGGAETATVTGPVGHEIHTEAHGRAKARLRWDRRGGLDDRASHWLRTMQPPTTGGMFLPRIGWEVLVGYLGRSGDEPYVLGRLYNGQSVPPESLPGSKVVSGFGSLTTPGGGSSHGLRIDDTAGAEGMLLASSATYNERTENDKGTHVKASSAHQIAGNHGHAVGIVHDLTVEGAQSYTVGANRTVTTAGNYVIQTGSESVLVGGIRKFQIGGDFETQAGVLSRSVGGAKAVVAIEEANRHVTGASLVTVGGPWDETGGVSSAVSVLGASALSVGGPIAVSAPKITLQASVLKENYGSRNVSASGARVEEIGGAATLNVGGSLSLSGANVYFKATGKITLKGPGATITITPSSITVDGNFDSSQASVVTGSEVVG